MSVRHIVHERLIPGQAGDGISPPEAAIIRNQIDTMPTVIAGNYTKRLANYESLAAAIADLPDGGAQGGEIQVDGEIPLTAPLVPTSNIHLVGRGSGATALLAPANAPFPMIRLDGASGAVIADMAIRNDTGTDAGVNGQGVLFEGDADDVVLDRLTIERFRGNVWFKGDAGTTPGYIRNVRLNGVRADHSTDIFGISFRYVDGVVLTQCTANYNWLDGLKLEQQARNVVDIGGTYSHNGQSWINTDGKPTHPGDGIDGFAGAISARFVGTTAEYNQGNGIILKTDNVSATDPDELAPRKIQAIGVSCKHNTYGHGFAAYRMPYGDDAMVTMAQVVVNGGEFEDNRYDGIFLGARNVAVTSPLVRLNGRDGIRVTQDGRYVTISNPMIRANGFNKSKGAEDGSFDGTSHGIRIGGQHVSVRGGSILGVDADDVFTDADLDSLPVWHTYNVYVTSTADDVYIDPDFEGYHAGSGPGMQTVMSSGTCIIHGRGVRGNPSVGGWYGSVGSTYTRVNLQGFPTAIRYTKLTGAPNAPNDGWVSDKAAPVVASLPAAASAYEGHMLVRGSDNHLFVCVSNGSGGWVWKQVTT